MPVYQYRCPGCRQEIEYAHSIRETDVPTWCGPCGCQDMHRVPLGGQGFVVKGSRLTETALRREFVSVNRDGSESSYRTREQAYAGELERTENPRIAAYNLKHLEKFGYVAGTDAARRAEALDNAPGGRVGSSVVT